MASSPKTEVIHHSYMRHTTLSPFSLLLPIIVGCSTPSFKVDLHTPSHTAGISNITVQDARLDKTLSMAVIEPGGVNLPTLLPDPALHLALEKYIAQAWVGGPVSQTVTVALQEIDLKNRVGFLKNDDQTCRIESQVVVTDQTNPRPIRTFVRNSDNASPMVYNAARIILQACLQQHANEIVSSLAR